LPALSSSSCATATPSTANPAEVIIAESGGGWRILEVIDGSSSKGVEGADGIAWRMGLLRKFGYKRG
jgi:adenosine/AMP kinase